MKNRILFISMFILATAGLAAQDLNLSQILEKYYLAGNFGKLSQVKTITMTGTLVQQDLMPVKIYRVRPDKYLMEFDVADLTARQAYDGQIAWFTAPWTGNAAPQEATSDRATDLKNRADMDGVLFDWQLKGHKCELEEKDTMNGLVTYKIKVTRKDGGIEYNYIDNRNFMLLKRHYYRQAGGKEVTVENFYRDYREVDGIPFAFTVETNNGGRVNEIQFETIELDKTIDMKVFRMSDR